MVISKSTSSGIGFGHHPIARGDGLQTMDMERRQMRRYTVPLATALAAMIAGPTIAAAQDAVTSVDLNMRAGPSTEFPVVDVVPDGAAVDVHGCVRGYSWCDVSWSGSRGWVSASYLQYSYQDRYVPIIEYGPRIEVPIIEFSVGTYWDNYYRGRPWYGQRARWTREWRSDRRDRFDRREDRREERVERRRDRRDDRVDRRRDRLEGRVERRQERREERVERRQDRRENRADRVRERRQDQAERRQERRENRAERMRDRREAQRNRGGRGEQRPTAGRQSGPMPGGEGREARGGQNRGGGGGEARGGPNRGGGGGGGGDGPGRRER